MGTFGYALTRFVCGNGTWERENMYETLSGPAT